MKQVFFLKVYEKGKDRPRYFGGFPEVVEALKLGRLVLRAGVFKSLKNKEQVFKAIEEWDNSKSINLKDGWMMVDEDCIYDTMEEYIER